MALRDALPPSSGYISPWPYGIPCLLAVGTYITMALRDTLPPSSRYITMALRDTLPPSSGYTMALRDALPSSSGYMSTWAYGIPSLLAVGTYHHGPTGCPAS